MSNPASLTFSRRLALAGPLALLPGCLPKEQLPPCPADPTAAGPVNWLPDVGKPVAWGEEHLTLSDCVPVPLSFYYPSARFIPPRPMLQQCAWSWPLVIFLHGHPPSGTATEGYHRAWWRIPVALARSGHVVLVPNLSLNVESSPAMVAPAVQWLFDHWHGAPWVNHRPRSRAVIGHSYGALLAARYAAATPGIGALGCLSGVFTEVTSGPAELLAAIPCTSFFMFAHRNGAEDLELPERSPLILKTRVDHYACIFNGEHFDYLDPGFSGTANRGPCPAIPQLSADLLALFIGSQLQSLTPIPLDLTPPSVSLTPAQEALAIQWLQAQPRICGEEGCDVTLQWMFGGEAHHRVIAPCPSG